jgi:CRISPR/Cas system-associated exonuclease Cas4 (RecB family)
MSESPDHTSRDHAEFSPSSLKYVAGCAGYDSRSGTNAAAEKGTRIHEALEVRDPSALHDEEELEIYNQIVEDEATFNESFFGEGEYIELNEIKVHVDLGGTSTWGTCDRFLVAGGKAVMADYKTGVSPIDSPKDNWQAKAYTLGAFQEYPDVQEITFVFYIPVRNEVLHDTFTRDDIAGLTKQLTEVIQKGEEIRPKWKGGSPDLEDLAPSVNCRFCKHEDHCPACGAIAVQVASRLSMIPADDVNIENSEDPVVLEQLWVVAKIVTNWASRIKAKAVDMAKGGTEFPTLRLKSMGSPRKCVDNKKLMKVAERFEMPQEDVLELARFPISALATEVGRRAPDGEKGQVSKDFLEALDDEDILVSSEKRYTLTEK